MRRLFIVIFLSFVGFHSKAVEPISPAHFAQAAEYSRAHGGLSLRVEQGGRLLFENYAHGYSASTSHKIYSGTKSFVAVAAALAEQQGLIRFDEKASDTLTEWRSDARRSITIGQLLSQTSGLNPDGGLIYPYANQMAAAVRVRLVDPPGTHFHYGAVNYQAFGEIMRRKHHDIEGLVKDMVLDPLDIDLSDWVRDRDGNVLIHSGMLLSVKEWVKFGAYMNRNRRESNQMNAITGWDRLTTGTKANPAYGMGFWLNNPQSVSRAQALKYLLIDIAGDQLDPGGPRDLMAAVGSGKQRLYMIPSLNLVVARFANGSAFSDGDFLSRLLTGKPHPDAHTH